MKVINLHQNEKTLIKQAIQNDRHAQQLMYSKFSGKMLSVCRQYIKDLQQAEDVMIIGFTKVFTHLQKFEHKGSFEGWIKRIMINESISYLRTQKQVKFIEDENYFEESYNNIESEFTVADIQLIIDQLPNGYKIVFNLYVIEGFKHHEIAQMLGINEGTSKSQLSHARKIIQHQLITLNNYHNGIK